MKNMKLILLRSDEPHHAALERLLGCEFDLRAVVTESGAAQTRRLLRRKRYASWLWRRYHTLRRSLCGSAHFRRKFFSGVYRQGNPKMSALSLQVDDINSPEVIECLTQTAHDWVIVIGTSILRPVLLSASPQRFINVHGGCLPDFRGNHAFFHAYLQNRPDCLASSIHFIDKGVDTGDVLAICPADLKSAPRTAGPEYFYCSAELRAFETLRRILREAKAGPPQTFRQPTGGYSYRTSSRTPIHEFFLLARWIKNIFYKNQLTQRSPTKS